MRIAASIRSLAILLLVFGAASLCSADVINPVVQYSSTSTLADTRPFTLGYSFTTTATFDINALGVWDSGSGQDQQVGIWDSTGNLLVSTTVSSSAPVTDDFQWNSVSYTLAPGSYTIGATFDNTGAVVSFPYNASGITSLPGYTWITDEQSFGTGLNFPTGSTGGSYGNNGILWADFSVGSSSSAVPEPTSLLLLGTGLGVIGLAAWRRKNA